MLIQVCVCVCVCVCAHACMHVHVCVWGRGAARLEEALGNGVGFLGKFRKGEELFWVILSVYLSELEDIFFINLHNYWKWTSEICKIIERQFSLHLTEGAIPTNMHRRLIYLKEINFRDLFLQAWFLCGFISWMKILQILHGFFGW